MDADGSDGAVDIARWTDGAMDVACRMDWAADSDVACRMDGHAESLANMHGKV